MVQQTLIAIAAICGFLISQSVLAQEMMICNQADGSTTAIVKNRKCQNVTTRVHGQDEVWYVSARESHCSPCDLNRLQVWRLDCGQWSCATVDDLVAAHQLDRTRKTVFYIHGNRTDDQWARARGFLVYQELFGCNQDCRPPVRLVVFAWRSEQDSRRALREYELKSRRCLDIGTTFGQLLARFQDRDMVLVGFSLGVQIIVSALENPELTCFTPGGDGKGAYRIALIAPSIDGGFTCDRSCARAWPTNYAVCSTDVFVNSVDLALRVADRVRRRQCPGGDVPFQTMCQRGQTVLNCIRFFDLASVVGKKHTVPNYVQRPEIKRSINQMVIELDMQTAPAGSNEPVADGSVLSAQ